MGHYYGALVLWSTIREHGRKSYIHSFLRKYGVHRQPGMDFDGGIRVWSGVENSRPRYSTVQADNSRFRGLQHYSMMPSLSLVGKLTPLPKHGAEPGQAFCLPRVWGVLPTGLTRTATRIIIHKRLWKMQSANSRAATVYSVLPSPYILSTFLAWSTE